MSYCLTLAKLFRLMYEPKELKRVHLMFSTLNNDELIHQECERLIHQIIRSLLIEQNCDTLAINGTADHVHILFTTCIKKPLVEIVDYIKEKSTFWINFNGLMNKEFSWQKGYGAFFIDENEVTTLSAYIHNQKEIHKQLTFKDEYMSYFCLHLI